MIYQLKEYKPSYNGTNFIADNATVIGDITLREHVSIWFMAVLRGDGKLVIDEKTNIQDGVVVHVDPGKEMYIGKNVTVGHQAMLHGKHIGDNCLIGINAVVLDGASIGNNCIIGANTLIKENAMIPDNSFVVGSPGKVIKQVQPEHIERLKYSAQYYVEAGEKYINSLKKI